MAAAAPGHGSRVTALLAERIWQEKVAPRSLAELHREAPRASLGEGGTAAPVRMSQEELQLQFSRLALAGGTMVVVTLCHKQTKVTQTCAGVILALGRLEPFEREQIPKDDVDFLEEYVFKVSPRTDHIAGVERFPNAVVYPLPHPNYEYLRIVHATVHQAEIRDQLIAQQAQTVQENAALKAENDALKRQLAAAAGGGGGPQYFPADMGLTVQRQRGQQTPLSADPYEWFRPSTWANHPVPPDSHATMVAQVASRLRVGPMSPVYVRETENHLRLWAEAVDAGAANGRLGELGDALMQQLRVASQPGAAFDNGVRTALRQQEFEGDELGAALAAAASRRGRRWKRNQDRSSRSSSAEGGACYACGASGHRAADCPDATKKKAWMEKKPAFRSGGTH